MIKKNIAFVLVVSFCLIAGFSWVKSVQADAGGPDLPACAGTYDYANKTKINPTCGYLNFSSYIDGSSYKDRFVFLEVFPGFEFSSMIYKAVSGEKMEDAPYKADVYYIAVNKSYFDNNGGLGGIFNSSTTIPDPNFPQYSATNMIPKNSADFAINSYTFIVSKADKNMAISQNTINDKYYQFRNISSYSIQAIEETPNLSCGNLYQCTKTISYVPQEIIGNYILLVPDKTTLTPENAEEPAPYIRPSDTPLLEQPSASPVATNYQVVVQNQPAPRTLSIWQRIWNWLIHLF